MTSINVAKIKTLAAALSGMDTVDGEQYAKAVDLFNKINGPAVFRVSWESTKPQAQIKKGHKHKVVTVVTEALAEAGGEYRNKATNRDRETGALPWGDWVIYPVIIGHRGNLYGRIEAVKGTVRSRYFIDGVEATRDEYVAVMNPSALKNRQADDENETTLTLTVKIQNLTIH